MTRTLDDIAPEERRLLLVATDQTFQDDVTSANVLRSLADIGKVISPLGTVGVGGAVALTEAFARLVKSIATGSAKREEVMWEFIRAGEQPMLRVAPDEAQRRYNFGVGHYPADGTIYVQHPCMTDRYIIPSEFNVVLAKEKIAAFKQLVAALGAKLVTLESADLVAKKGWLSAKGDLAQAAAQVGLNVTLDAERRAKQQSFMEFDDPQRAPYVPAELNPWVLMDAELRTMVNNRINAKLRKDRVTIEIQESCGIDASAVGRLMGKGLSVGGGYQRVQHTVWNYEIEYWPWTGNIVLVPSPGDAGS